MTAPYPVGFQFVLDADTRMLADGALYGGSPRRILRLSPRGRLAWEELTAGQVKSTAGLRLARTLTDAGMLHPHPAGSEGPTALTGLTGLTGPAGPTRAAPRDVTVVIPVRDRVAELARCLTALEAQYPVLVVDDASARPAAVAAVCAEHGASLIVRSANGGPAAARTSALERVQSEFVLFLDSDTVPSRDLVARLAAHVEDPLVGAVAPRIIALPGASSATRYGVSAGSLDLGDRPARVVPGTRVSYVPSAALLVRRSALEEVGGFDPRLRYGEDVDLVWLLDAAGWRVRYDPSVTVRHAEPSRWLSLLRRRYQYGTSAGPLAQRHRGRLAPIVVHSWSGVAAFGLLARRPSLVLAGLTGSAIALRRTLNEVDAEATGAPLEAVKAVAQTWRETGKTATQFATPLLAAAAITGGSRARGRRLALAAFLLTGPVAEWVNGPRTLDPGRFIAGRVADDIAYGAGVLTSCISSRTVGPLTPRITGRLLRLAPLALQAIPSAAIPSAAGRSAAGTSASGPMVAAEAPTSRKRRTHA